MPRLSSLVYVNSINKALIQYELEIKLIKLISHPAYKVVY